MSLELTVQSLNTYGAGHPHWVIAYSGGKDSTSLLVAVDHLIQAGRVRHLEGVTWRPGEVSAESARESSAFLPLPLVPFPTASIMASILIARG